MNDQRYRVFGKQGEFDLAGMRDLIRHGEVTSLTDVALSGENQWRSAGFYPQLQRYLTLAAKTRPQNAVATPQPSGSSFDSSVIMAIGAIVVGVVLMAASARDLMWGLASTHWPTAQAQLIDSELVERRSRSRGRTRTHYQLRASYAYSSADGRRHVSREVSFGREWFRNARRDYSAIQRSPLLAYYDPNQPSNAVLHPGVSGTPLIMTFAGVAAIALGLLGLFRPAMARSVLERVSALSKISLRARA